MMHREHINPPKKTDSNPERCTVCGEIPKDPINPCGSCWFEKWEREDDLEQELDV